MIHEGLDSKSFDTRHSAKRFADSLKRTSRILKAERQKRLKDDGKRYLQQLVFMTKYLLQNPGLSIENRMQRLGPKLKELERHQLHQLYVLQHYKQPKAIKKKARKK